MTIYTFARFVLPLPVLMAVHFLMTVYFLMSVHFLKTIHRVSLKKATTPKYVLRVARQSLHHQIEI